MYLVCVAKEKSLLSGINLEDDDGCMAGVDNSRAIFGPQSLPHKGQNQSHTQKPSQVPLDCLEGKAHMHMQRHTHTSHV